ncbi:MAG: ribonuclease E/G [Lachnospiraceae bacterium]|nr:ribonuclease E/G [Lachnospiraceae bacterium]
MGYQLLITPCKNKIISALYDGKRPVQFSVEEQEPQKIRVGGIYVGRVANIVSNINAAFVEIKPGIMGYLALGQAAAPITADTHPDGRIHAGDELVVQVEREPIKSKLASVTTNINLTGKFAVLIHGKSGVGVSSKITDPAVRARLKELFSGYAGRQEQGQEPADTLQPRHTVDTGYGCGFIVRTNAAQAGEGELTAELAGLKRRYEKLLLNGIHRTRFSVLEEPLPAYLCGLRDQYSGQLEEFVTDDPALYGQMYAYLSEYQTEDLSKLKLYQEELPLKVLYSLEHRLREALQKKVWLKSGASLVIEPTEALTVIDVNTGKAVKGREKIEKHFLKINLEAAKEIAYQIRLRNLSGIILVDFIDMQEDGAVDTLMRTLREYLAEDPVKTTLVDITPLHLVEITRKKVRRPLHEEGMVFHGKNECDAPVGTGED